MLSIRSAVAFVGISPAPRLSLRRVLFPIALAAGLSVALLVPGASADPAVATPAPPAHSGPVLLVQGTSQDGGTVEEGTVLKYRFMVTNPGDADLEIKQVKPSCGCTVPHWDKLLAPGKEGSIDAEVHTEHFRGAILKHLTVFSNDTRHPEL